jgi:hypothetical protein
VHVLIEVVEAHWLVPGVHSPEHVPVLALHVYGHDVGAGWVQAPPWQVQCPIDWFPEQVALAPHRVPLLTWVVRTHWLVPVVHEVAWFQHSSPATVQGTPALQALQVPLLHTPVPQTVPLLTLVHVPVELAQVWHSPHGVEQQVVPTQLPLRHCWLAPEVQLCPLSYLGVQVPPRQKFPFAQSASTEQEPVLQAVADAHAISPGQAVAAPATQVWLALHVLLVSVAVAAAQDGVPQSTPSAA